MAITFHCPKCKGLCAFREQHAGKHARCTSCQARFIIPEKDGEKPIPLKVEYYNDGGVVSGFYRAVFVESWKLFVNVKNITGLVLVVAAVIFKFILANHNYVYSVSIPATGNTIDAHLPLGAICEGLCWGVIFWYYMEIIYSVAFKVDELPRPSAKTFAEMMGNGLRSAYYFFVTLFVIFLPSIIIVIINEFVSTDIRWMAYFAAIISGVLLPAAILRISVMQDIYSLLRIDRLIYPILKIPLPYATVTFLIVITAVAEHFTQNYTTAMITEPYLAGLNLAGKLAGQIPALIAMRSVGLLYRHYEGYAV